MENLVSSNSRPFRRIKVKRRENIVPFRARRLFRENEFSFVLFPPLYPPGNTATMLKRRKIIPKISLSPSLPSLLCSAYMHTRQKHDTLERNWSNASGSFPARISFSLMRYETNIDTGKENKGRKRVPLKSDCKIQNPSTRGSRKA